MDIWLIATLNRLFIIDIPEKWTLRWYSGVGTWGGTLRWDPTVYDKTKV